MNNIKIIKDTIHIWIGKVAYSEQEYWAYFDDSQSSVLDENGYARNKNEIINSPFSIDVGLEYDYNPDFIGFYFDKKPQKLEVVLQQQPAIEMIPQIIKDCHKKNILKANAMFYYSDDNLTIDKNKLFNGMQYIGKYDWHITINKDDNTENTLGEDFWDNIFENDEDD